MECRPVGSGKTALTLALCRIFRDTHNIGEACLGKERRRKLTRDAAVVTNDIFTKEDQQFLIANGALADQGRIRAIETGESQCALELGRPELMARRWMPARGYQVRLRGGLGQDGVNRECREDISANIGALEELQATYGCEMLFVESGGDNLAGGFARAAWYRKGS